MAHVESRGRSGAEDFRRRVVGVVATIVFGWAIMMTVERWPVPLSSPVDDAGFVYAAHNLPPLATASLFDRGTPPFADFSRNPFQFAGIGALASPPITPTPVGSSGITADSSVQPLAEADPCTEARTEYLGYFGPAELSVAALRRGGSIEVAVRGDHLDGGFTIVAFDATMMRLRRDGIGDGRECRLMITPD